MPAVTLQLVISSSPTPTALSLLGHTATPPLHEEVRRMEAYAVVIVVIFCAVCFLLLLAFSYTFCFHCSISSAQKDAPSASGCSLDPEDTTYRHSSSQSQPPPTAL